jgi:dihydrofolate reductase
MSLHCSVFIATSLDGYIARTDGRLDWLGTVQRPGEDYGYARFSDTVDAVVLGRTTYDTVLGFGSDAWQYGGKRVVVMTHRPAESRHGESFFAGTPAELVATLAAEGHRRVYVDGGRVIQQFLAAGLLDDLTVSVIPVVLGAGIPLFAGSEHPLALDGVEAFASGLVQLKYRLNPAAGGPTVET